MNSETKRLALIAEMNRCVAEMQFCSILCQQFTAQGGEPPSQYVEEINGWSAEFQRLKAALAELGGANGE